LAKPEMKFTPVRLALVGADTLLGRELQEVLDSRLAGSAITSYSATGEGNFGEQEGEAVYVEPLNAETIARDQAVLLAGREEGARKAYELAKAAGAHPLLIDCTGHLEMQPEARIVSPLLEEPDINASWLQVVAHPAASAVAFVLTRLAQHAGIQEVVAHVFEPASERGQAGLTELNQQTAGLLSFKALDKDVFDTQLSFNVLPHYGSEAPLKLSTVEQRIERHIATILSRQLHERVVPMPSLRLVQAPVFHGYGISLWVHFQTNVSAQEVAQTLTTAGIEVRGEFDEPPNNAAVAGQSGFVAGDIRLDRNNAKAAWIWLVCDNLRIVADAATEIIMEIKAVRK
jgi:aspartate-semialdehyde dehydrogenase